MPDALPGFLIIGAPKCGTTAVAQYLASHPDVGLSSPKEPHFFDGAHHDDLDRYARHFAKCGNARVTGEATPSYLHLPWVPERIRASLPDARLIALLRDPADRAFSSWWMLHARGMEPLSFEDAIEAELAQSDGALAPGPWQEHLRALAAGDPIRVRTYLAAGRYASNLARYFELFPRERIEVVFSDELARDTDRVVRSLWRHLGVSDDAAIPDAGRVNERIGAGAQPLLRLMRATGLMRIRTLVPESLRNRLKKGLSRAGDAPSLPPAMRRLLVERFEPETSALERLLDVDLAAWRR